MEVAVERVLEEPAARPRPIAQVQGADVFGLVAVGGGHGDVHPPRHTTEVAPREQLLHHRSGLLDSRVVPLAPRGQIDGDLPVLRYAAQVRGHSLRHLGEPGQLGVADDEVDVLVLPVVVGRAQQLAVVLVEPQVPKLADAVVAPGVDLQQHLLEVPVASVQPVPEQRAALGVGGVHQALDGLRAPRTAGVGLDDPQRALGRLVLRLHQRLQHGFVEVAEDHVVGQLGNALVPDLGRGRQPVEPGAHLLVGKGRQFSPRPEAPLEDRHHDGDQLADPAEGPEHPEHCRFQLRRALEPVDAVAGQRGEEARAIGVGQPRAVGVEPLQVGEQVLLGAGGCQRVAGLGLRPRAIERAHLREQVEQPVLAAEQPDVGGRADLAEPALFDEQPPHHGRVEVVAEEVVPQRAEDPLARWRSCRGPRLHPRQVERRRSDGLAAGRLGLADAQHRSTGGDLGVRHHLDRRHLTGVRRSDRGLHLHALQHRDRVPFSDPVPDLHQDRDHERRPTGSHDAAVVARDPVGGSVHHDPEHRTLRHRHHAMVMTRATDPALVGVDEVDLEVGVHLPSTHPEGAGGRAVAPEVMGRPGVAQPESGADGLGPLGAAPPCAGVEGCLRRRVVRGVRLDGRGEQGDRLRCRNVIPCRGDPVQPPVVVVTRHHLRPVEHSEQEGPVRRASLDDDRALGQGSTQAGERLVAILAPGDDLGDHRVELVGDQVALTDSGVDTHAAPGRQAEHRDPTRSRDEALLGVLCAQARLDGVPAGERGVALQPMALRHA